MKRASRLSAAVLLLPLAAGCGGDEDSGTERYRDQANRICAAAKREIDRLPGPRNVDGLVAYVKRGLLISERRGEEFDALEPPAELRAGHDELVRLGDRAVGVLRGLVDEVEGGEAPLRAFRRALPELGRITELGNARARRMGLPGCVTDPLAPPGANAEPAPS